MGMGRSDILTEELKKVLLDIEYWLKDMYLDGIKVDKSSLSGTTLKTHNEWISGINESLVLISSVLNKLITSLTAKELT